MRLVIAFVLLGGACSPPRGETKEADLDAMPIDADRHCVLAMEFASRGTCLAAGEQLAHCAGPREAGARAHAEKLCPPAGAPRPPEAPAPSPAPPRTQPDGPSQPGTPEPARPAPGPEPTAAPEPRPPMSPRPPPYVIPSTLPPLPPMPGAPPPAEPLRE